MEKQPIILVGGGGHCKYTIDVIEAEGKYYIKGITDLKEKVGESILGHPIIGCNDDLKELVKTCSNFVITVGQIKSANLRKKLFDLIKQVGGKFPVIVSPNAHASKHSEIGEGTVVFHNVVINANAKIGINCILNTKCVIEHDAKVGNNCHVSTGAIINGDSVLGSDSFLGSMSCISSQVKVGNNCVIGAGSLIVKNLEDNTIAYGNPLKHISN